MVGRSSFSQHNTFLNCIRWWYLQHVRKIPYVSDMCYANAGNVVHKTLEKFYNKQIIDINLLKEQFIILWDSYQLPNSKLKYKKDEYWLMILNGIELNVEITTTEMKIYYPDVVGYLDAVDTNTDEIKDWKTSTRSEINEEEYIRQMFFYSWLYYRKFNRLPTKVTVYYLKYKGEKGYLSVVPTMEDIKKTEEEYYKILEQMDNIRQGNELPPMCETECHFFCPYKNYCFSNENAIRFTLHIEHSRIQLEGPITKLLEKGIENKFSYELKDAYFIKKAQPHANTMVRFYNSYKRSLPIGFKDGLIKTLKDYAEHIKKELVLDIKDNRVFDNVDIEMPDSFVNGVKLRDYQTDAVDKFIREKMGILEMGTGSGKTEISIEIIRRLGKTTLFIVDKIELLKQTKQRIEDSLGIEVGQVGGGVIDWHQVTVATIQTLVKHLVEFAPYLRTFRIGIFDECHKISARSYIQVGTQMINTEYRLGMSGTAFRDDGNDMGITSVVGDKIFDLSSKELIKQGWLVKPTIEFVKNYMPIDEVKAYEERLKTGLINETLDYANSYNVFISQNKYRNDTIIDLVNKNQGKKILILTKLVDHGKELEENILGSRHLYGGTNKIEREEILNQFKAGDINILISTISIFAEGLDIPSLDIVLNASANKGNVKTIQVLGRVLRKLEGKENAKYIDFMDELKFFTLASLARKKALIKEGHDVKIVENQ